MEPIMCRDGEGCALYRGVMLVGSSTCVIVGSLILAGDGWELLPDINGPSYYATSMEAAECIVDALLDLEEVGG